MEMKPAWLARAVFAPPRPALASVTRLGEKKNKPRSDAHSPREHQHTEERPRLAAGVRQLGVHRRATEGFYQRRRLELAMAAT
mgnify:CR=1